MPDPEPGPGEVVVAVRAALTCGTDLKAYLRGHPQIPMPGPFGHEYAGVVSAVGEGVTQFTVGEAVMGVHSAPCGACYWCDRSQGNLCPDVMRSKVLGAFAEQLRIPAHIVRQNLFPKPAHLRFEEAALLEPLSCVVYGLAQVPVGPHDTVVLIGSGPIALLFLAVLKARGVQAVVMSGRRAERLAAAQAMGADVVCDASRDDLGRIVTDHTQGRGADVVVECTGQVPVWQEAVGLARRGGHVVLFGGPPPGTQVAFDTHRLHYDQMTLHSPFHFTPEAVREARELLISGHLKLRPLVSERLPLAQTQVAFERLRAGDGIKFNLVPGGEGE